jgi:hypothetical protein
VAIAWINASSDGAPAPVGTAVHGPAVASYDTSAGAGYVIAWAGEDGAHARVARAMDDPAPVCGVGPGMPCIDPRPPYNTSGFTAGERRTTAALVLGAELHLAGEGPRASVSVAAGGADGSEIVLAWAEAAAVVVARVRVDAAALTIAERETMRFPANGAQAVAVVHLDRNVAQEGAVLEGDAVGADETGGFAISWSDRDSTYVVRTSDALDRVLDPAPVAIGPSIDAARAFVDAQGRGRLVARSGDSLVVFPSLCGL